MRGSWWFIRVGQWDTVCIYGIEWYGEEVVFRAEKVVMETSLVERDCEVWATPVHTVQCTGCVRYIRDATSLVIRLIFIFRKVRVREVMSPSSPFPVKVLNITSPACISVRPLLWEKAAYELQEKLACHYNAANRLPLPKVNPGTMCVARCGTGWYRAVVAMQEREGNTVSVRLVDQGRMAITHIGNILPLALKFFSSPSFSISCHLHGLQPWIGTEWQDNLVMKMTGLLPPSQVVTLVRRGAPVQTSSGQHSLPVDITWEEVTMPDPFLPNLVKEFSLTELCAEKLGLSTGELEETVACDTEEQDIKENDLEFFHVEPLQCLDNFHWLDPELPSSTQFSARGTYVDESGQIYIQLNTQRHTVRVIRKLLNEKFSSSQPDTPARKLRHSQECCARWWDGNWYRARFIKYLDTEEQESLVVLVDYGNMFSVREEDIRRTIYGQHIPIQSLRIVLAGVRPMGDTWSQECLDWIQEKINYARMEGNYKMRVKLEGTSQSQPLQVSISDRSKEGVIVDLAHLLAMFPGEVTIVQKFNTLPAALRRQRESLDWGVKEVPAGYYKEKNPYLLLCPQSGPVQHISTIPSIEWDQVRLVEGQLLQVKLVDMDSYNCLYVHPTGTEGDYLANVTAQHIQLAVKAQALCELSPPVLQPRPGLPVAVRWGVDGWYRAVIRECTDTAVFVNYVDYGTSDWVEDSMMVREMDEEWRALPALAIPLQLALEAVETDLDILTSLVMECLWTWEEDLWLRVDLVEEGGSLRGHLVNKETGDVLYRGLIREGVIKIM